MSATDAIRPSLDRVVVVGASLAGLPHGGMLREHASVGSVVVIGDEPHRPYDRPPLSKKLLSGEWEPDRIHLRQPDILDELDVVWQLGTTAAGLDLNQRRVELANNKSVPFDGLIIATGARPRRLPGHDTFDHVHELRSLDDAMALRREIAPGGRRVVVIGAASSASKRRPRRRPWVTMWWCSRARLPHSSGASVPRWVRRSPTCTAHMVSTSDAMCASMR